MNRINLGKQVLTTQMKSFLIKEEKQNNKTLKPQESSQID